MRALAVFDDGAGPALYAGGGFSEAGGINANRIAKWDGSSWSALDSGTSGEVHALSVFDDGGGGGPALYVGGQFATAGGITASRIARWDGFLWSAVGTSGANNIVLALGVLDDSLWVSGTFTTMGGDSSQRIAHWGGCPVDPPTGPCYADCDGNEELNINDFLCFIDEFAIAQTLPVSQQIEHYANCDGSTSEPVLSINDFLCFIDEFAQGCP